MNKDFMIERIVRRQELANEKILKEIGKILGEIGELNPSEINTIIQQLKYGESLQKILKILSETSNINQQEIYRMLEADARFNLLKSKIYFNANNIDFIPYEQNMPLKNLVNQIAYTTMEEYKNISRTTGLTYLNSQGERVTKNIFDAYNEIVDDAINNVAMGKETFQQALKNQLKTIGEAGIQKIEYKSGYHRRIDSSLRMNLNDGLNQLAISQQEIMGNQFNNDAWEVTTHEFPAVDHAPIQGHIFRKEEFKKLQDFNYYGEIKDVNNNVYVRDEHEHIRPIGELNCKHFAFAIVLGVDEPRYTQEELDKINDENEKGFNFEGRHYTMYQGTQLQRDIELEIRKQREISIMGENGNQPELVQEANKNINILLSRYHKLSKTSGLKTRLERTKILTKNK